MIAWMREAACKERPDLDWFDLYCGLKSAVEICYACPVRERCLEYAIDNRFTDGVWGGLWGSRLGALIEGRRGGRDAG